MSKCLSDVFPLTLKTEDIGLHLHEETDLVLNCTYHKESSEYIGNRDIRWQKWIGNTFKDLAAFSPPGGQSPFIGREMESLYSKRTELIAPTDGSLSAVMILKELVCDDVGEYRCLVEYYSDIANHVSTSLSTVAFKGKNWILYVTIVDVFESIVRFIISGFEGSSFGGCICTHFITFLIYVKLQIDNWSTSFYWFHIIVGTNMLSTKQCTIILKTTWYHITRNCIHLFHYYSDNSEHVLGIS